jgi:metal transporter CNNM
LGTVATGVVAGILATALIFVFGELMPQSIISRFALRFGAVLAPLVRVFLFILHPICYPISLVLDRLVGQELPEMYSRKELERIISEHQA